MQQMPTNKYGNGYKGKKYVHDEETMLFMWKGWTPDI